MKHLDFIGAVVGDIAGSRFEFNNYRAKDFSLFSSDSDFTDDTVMTLAVFEALMRTGDDFSALSENASEAMLKLGRAYLDRGYGGRFYRWLLSERPKPYNSFGNGSAMRVSGCGFWAKSVEETCLLSQKVTSPTHNHPEGLKGAEAAAVAVFLAKTGGTKEEIRRYMEQNYYPATSPLAEVRKTYEFDVSCQGTLPYALQAFYEANDFEDAIRNAVSIGGDSDTIAAITGAIAGAFYGIPEDICEKALAFLSVPLRAVVTGFEKALSERG